MTERSRHWDGILIGDATLAPYSATEWADQERLEHGQGSLFPNYGILNGTGDGTYAPLAIQAKSPASSNIEVEVGAALVNGRLYENTAALTFTVGANASGNPRIDTVILRADFTAQTVRAVVKQGTPAGSPSRPSLQQDTSIWEIPLADIAVANGFTVINQTDITNRQRSVLDLYKGWQNLAYPLTYSTAINYDAATTAFAPSPGNQLVAVPILLVANMLVQDVTIRHIGGAITYVVDWAIYKQDTNDGQTAEKNIRAVATGGGSGSPAGTGNITINATPIPQVLTPGAYWLVLHNQGGSVGGILLGTNGGNNFDASGAVGYYLGTQNIVGALPQLLDMTAVGWTAFVGSLSVRLRGRVFGKTSH